ncbi:phosphatase PAP2 family protein [Streptomyces marispadix]|uniref:Phosphatase PAP2 family protein n=1 Tax=Streptomyces marispadix TaxID=2922868 RepID=A0ABS9SS55_9ACTN|nr:phosphatase PAP2 family protein [Streptomyces marispadix]MCH6159101.1 phosphatase PAP2 family protein [Streptomyces marispadix]
METSEAPSSRRPWLRTALALGAAGAVVIVLVAVGWRPLVALDRAVAHVLHVRALAHPDWTGTNRILTDWVWDPVTMRLLVLAAALWVGLRGERLRAVWCAVTAAAGAGVQQALKALLDRERPQWEHPVDSAQYSAMPSGHVMTAALACTLLVWLVRRTDAGAPSRALVLAAAVLSVAGVALTRVALGVHWLTDTVAGAALGVALAAAAIGAFESFSGRTARRGPSERADSRDRHPGRTGADVNGARPGAG